MNRDNEEKCVLDGLNVLAAEDNEFNQLILAAQAKKLGFNLTMTGNGKEAIQKLENIDFDLILMDINMPVMDGFEAVRNIRSKFPSPKNDIPVIAITAYGLIYDRDQALDAGMDEYIAKPFTMEELQYTICKVLGIGNKEESWKAAATTVGTTINFDLSEIRAIYNNQQENIRATVESFIRNTKDGFDKMSHYINDNIPETLRILHKIKSSFPYLGMHKTYEDLLEIEGFLKSGIRHEESKERLMNIKENLSTVYEKLIEEIENDHIKNHTP